MWNFRFERGSLRAVACVFLYLVAVGRTTSSQTPPEASIAGTVRDINAEEVRDIGVVLHNLKTGAEQHTKTDRFGEYAFSRVSPGI